MRRPRPFSLLLLAALGGGCLLSTAGRVRAQTNATPGFMIPYKKGNVTVFRASGKSMRMISTTVYEVPGFKLETFSPDGTPNLIGEAPLCIFNLATTNASSSGPIAVRQVGGVFSMTGEGFNWNHAAQRLQLSNRVHAVFRMKSPAALLPTSK